MNASMLIKFLPMLVMLVSLAYAAYTVQWTGSTLGPILNQAALKQVRTRSAGPGSAASRAKEDSPAVAHIVRDPFQMVTKPTPGQSAPRAGSDQATTPSDPNAGFVQNLTLNATWLQGRSQLAVINGKSYKSGQHLENRDGQPSPLFLTRVFANKVILEAEGKHYVLAYPDNFDTPVVARQAHREPQGPPKLGGLDSQLALIQALLESPLGGPSTRLLGTQPRNLVSNADSLLLEERAQAPTATGLSRTHRPVPTGVSSSPESDQ